MKQRAKEAAQPTGMGVIMVAMIVAVAIVIVVIVIVIIMRVVAVVIMRESSVRVVMIIMRLRGSIPGDLLIKPRRHMISPRMQIIIVRVWRSSLIFHDGAPVDSPDESNYSNTT